jgi:hypothetical protein
MNIPRVFALLAAAWALCLAGCGDGGGEETVSCEQAFTAADKERELQDTDKYLDPAFTACSTLSEFKAASEAHPGVLGNTSAEAYVTERCRGNESLAGTPLCTALRSGY